ncbi:hypothetical protein Naga_100139g15 [Nannochloropsis gaditana]|uniref:Uncharacterized protein n=1 Tax=Nannochloropsis gaditana TaxID=72520 RepID=W7TBG5_9STRA|nr:hypothetical protein Naga_100139g15 [Nannochloropsis gaditana]
MIVYARLDFLNSDKLRHVPVQPGHFPTPHSMNHLAIRHLKAWLVCFLVPVSIRAFKPLSSRPTLARPSHHMPSPGICRNLHPPRPFSSSTAPSSSLLLPRHAWPQTRDPTPLPPDYPLAAARVGITVLACLLTSYSHTSHQAMCASPVLASAAVTLAASLIAPGLGQAAMCGSFAGMSSPLLLPSFAVTLATGVCTSILFEAFIHYRNAALGLGGRLGATAFLAVNLIAASQRHFVVPASSSPFSFSSPTRFSLSLPALLHFIKTSPYLPLTIIYGALGSVATIALREASDDNAAADPVRAAAVVGLISALTVGVYGHTSLGSLAAYGGAFVGMSLPSRLLYGAEPVLPPLSPDSSSDSALPAAGVPTPSLPSHSLTSGKLLASFSLAGALGGAVHGLTLHLGWWTLPVAGWGGKAGMCSFVGVLIFRGLLRSWSGLKNAWTKRRA